MLFFEKLVHTTTFVVIFTLRSLERVATSFNPRPLNLQKFQVFLMTKAF